MNLNTSPENNVKQGVSRLQWLWFTLLMLGLLLAFLWLAFWQLDRAEEKEVILTAIKQAPALPLIMVDSNSPRFSKVNGRGHYDTEHSFLLDNQVEGGVVGVHLYTPLQLPNGEWRLVNRGWLAMALDRRELPQFTTPTVAVKISGILNLPPKTGVRIGSIKPLSVSEPWPRLITYLELEPIAQQLGYPLQAHIIQLDDQSESGYGERQLRPLNFGPEKHRGYALTWFAFAIVAVILFIIIIRLGTKKNVQQS